MDHANDAAGPQSFLAEALKPGRFVKSKEDCYRNGENIVSYHVYASCWLLLSQGLNCSTKDSLAEIEGHEYQQQEYIFIRLLDNHRSWSKNCNNRKSEEIKSQKFKQIDKHSNQKYNSKCLLGKLWIICTYLLSNKSTSAHLKPKRNLEAYGHDVP